MSVRVTLTIVLNTTSCSAAVKAPRSKVSPLAVGLPSNPGPYQVASQVEPDGHDTDSSFGAYGLSGRNVTFSWIGCDWINGICFYDERRSGCAWYREIGLVGGIVCEGAGEQAAGADAPPVGYDRDRGSARGFARQVWGENAANPPTARAAIIIQLTNAPQRRTRKLSLSFPPKPEDRCPRQRRPISSMSDPH